MTAPSRRGPCPPAPATGLAVGRAVCLLWFALAGPAGAAAPEVRHVEPDNATASSKAVVVGPVALAHTAQLLPLDRGGRVVGGGAGAQAEKLLENLAGALAEVKSGLDGLVKLNVYVTRDDVAEAVTRVMARRIPKKARPAVCFVTTRLPHPDALVALDAVAVAPAGRGGSAAVAVLPDGARVYVSGQAEKGDLAAATRKTLESLKATLAHLRLTTQQVVQVKAFLQPMSESAVVTKEVEAFFGKGKAPPLVLVEWKSSPTMPIEIELVAAAGRAYPSAADVVDYLTPPGMTASPIFSRVARVHYGPSVYISGLYAGKAASGKAEVEELFESLKPILKQADSDLKHLVKATYYVSADESSRSLNELRPRYYDPKRPPAASKAAVAGVGRAGRTLTLDMIAVPTMRVPESPPEYGHGLTEKDAAEGWLSLFDGKSPFGWKGATLEGDALRGPGTTTTEFGRVALRAEFAKGGSITAGGREIKVGTGPFALSATAGRGPVRLGEGVVVRELSVRPLDMKAIFNGKDLDGWKRVDRLPEDRRPVWNVEGGNIVATGGPGALEHQGGTFGDLVLQLDVRTRKRHVNGGVFFRCIPGDFMNGYEAQVYNRCHDGDPARPATWCTGGIDDRQNARRMVGRDLHFFTMTVLARGPHLATWINGHQVTDWSDPRKPHLNPRQGLRTEPGTIQLQAHDADSDLEFKNIRVLALP